MQLPETTIATISFAPIEFHIMQEEVESLKRLPQTQRELDDSLQSIQRDWQGMSEAEIQEQARERATSQESISRYGGSVIVGHSTKLIRAYIASEHPVLQAAKQIIKEGPPVIRVLEGSDEYWRLDGLSEESIRSMNELFPETPGDPSDGRDMVERVDYSQGTGLSMRGINIRTNKADLGAWGLAPIAEGGPKFDIGFVVDTSQRRQDVEVTILERTEIDASLIAEHIIDLLPHLREVD